MEWISVNERLPEKDTTVLVALGECVTIADWYVKDGWSLDRELTALFPTRTVTHWMPLPEPPAPRNEKMLDALHRSKERMKDVPVSGSTEETLKMIRRARAGEMWGYEVTDEDIESKPRPFHIIGYFPTKGRKVSHHLAEVQCYQSF